MSYEVMIQGTNSAHRDNSALLARFCHFIWLTRLPVQDVKLLHELACMYAVLNRAQRLQTMCVTVTAQQVAGIIPI